MIKKLKTFELALEGEAAMLQFGASLFNALKERMIIFLDGELGTGKTTLTRGFLQASGYTGKVKSPTYTLVESYEINQKKIFHFDFYRLRDAKELEYIGIDEYFAEAAICLIEWPEKGFPFIPEPDLICFLAFAGSGRSLRLEAGTEAGESVINTLATSV